MGVGLLGLLSGVAWAEPAAPSQGGVETRLGRQLRAADRALAEVLPDSKWALFCDVRFAETSTEAFTYLSAMVTPCDPETVVAPGFDPLPMYVGIEGDRDSLRAEVRFGALRGCWRLTDEAQRRAKKWGRSPEAATLLIVGYRGFSAHLVRRGVESTAWARRLLRAAVEAAPSLKDTGRSDVGELYGGTIGQEKYLLALDGDGMVRWLEATRGASSFWFSFEPKDGALLPDRSRFQQGDQMVNLRWRYQQRDGRWLPESLELHATEGRLPRVLLEGCVYDGTPQGGEAKARFDAAHAFEAPPATPKKGKKPRD